MEFLVLELVYGYEGHSVIGAAAFTFRAGAGAGN
jgi:hypothetical protein